MEIRISASKLAELLNNEWDAGSTNMPGYGHSKSSMEQLAKSLLQGEFTSAEEYEHCKRMLTEELTRAFFPKNE